MANCNIKLSNVWRGHILEAKYTCGFDFWFRYGDRPLDNHELVDLWELGIKRNGNEMSEISLEVESQLYGVFIQEAFLGSL